MHTHATERKMMMTPAPNRIEWGTDKTFRFCLHPFCLLSPSKLLHLFLPIEKRLLVDGIGSQPFVKPSVKPWSLALTTFFSLKLMPWCKTVYC